MIINSLDNNRIKELVKLQKRKYRDETNLYVVEGEHLCIESLKSGCLEEVFIVEGASYDFPNITYISSECMKKVSTMDTPSTIIGLCRKIENKNIGSRILLLDSLQDPGNLGTIIRSSVAFNIDTIILSENTVDLYNPKVLRATQGMYNYINIFSMNAIEAIEKIKNKNIKVYGTNVNNGVDVRKLDVSEKNSFCLIMGNEGNGVRKEIQELCDKNLYIDMNSNVESLNVAIACSILIYELGRLDG